jgi:hypothetical protein
MKHAPLILAILLVGVGVFAQGPGGPPPEGGRPPMMRYDASKEVTLQGTVSAVTTATRGPGTFVTLTFVADGTTYQVLAGPEALLKQSQVSFAKGDALTIVGVAMTGPQGTAFMARQITKGDTVVTLLDGDGRPVNPN